MASKDTSFRICGESLGTPDAFRDVDVAGVEYDGTIVLDDETGDGPWYFDAEKLEALRDSDLCVFATDVPAPDHAIWGDIESIATTRKEGNFSEEVEQLLRDSERSAFRAAIKYGK